MWRIFKTAHCKVHDFTNGRTRQSDDEFLRDCEVALCTDAAKVTLAVRRAVAGIGLVDPLFVRAYDSFPGTLSMLPLWDSMDWISFHLELERELGLERGSSQKLIRDDWEPSNKQTISVRTLAERVREMIERQ